MELHCYTNGRPDIFVRDICRMSESLVPRAVYIAFLIV